MLHFAASLNMIDGEEVTIKTVNSMHLKEALQQYYIRLVLPALNSSGILPSLSYGAIVLSRHFLHIFAIFKHILSSSFR